MLNKACDKNIFQLDDRDDVIMRCMIKKTDGSV